MNARVVTQIQFMETDYGLFVVIHVTRVVSGAISSERSIYRIIFCIELARNVPRRRTLE